MKVKKEKSKAKKKKTKPTQGYLDKKFGLGSSKHLYLSDFNEYLENLENKDGSKGPLSINIVNTNHLHLSGYTNPGKQNKSQQNKSADAEKKENCQSIVKKFTVYKDMDRSGKNK